MMSELVNKVKQLKTQTYNEFTGESLLKQLEEHSEREAGLTHVLGIIDKQGYTQELYNAPSAGIKTAEGFVFQFTEKLVQKFKDEAYEDIANYLNERRKDVSFSKLCFSIGILSKVSYKTHPEIFTKVCSEMLYMADNFYRVVFEIFFFKGQQIDETEQKVLLSTGYLKTSKDIIEFIKNNKKLLDFSTGKFTALKITDFLSFDGETIQKQVSVSKSQLNVNEFVKFVGNLCARLDIVKHLIEANPSRDVHEIVAFRDIKETLSKLEDKISTDPLAIIESESGYFQYRKYHVLSLRRDKVFNLHKNIVVNTEQEDDHLAPANEIWEGYGGTYPLYLVKNHLSKDRSLYSMLSPGKLAKLIMHCICSVPENVYTAGDYFIDVFQFIQAKLQRCSFQNLPDLNQDNAFWYDTFVALKRIDFNVRPARRPAVTSFFNFMINYVTDKQTRFILVTKFLDMDYVETFFQTSSMSIGILQIISKEFEEAKYNAFTEPEIFLRKEQLEKIWGHVVKGDHKQLGMLRSGLRIIFSILQTLKDFNAADWLKANSLKEFYVQLDPTVFDPLKESLLARVGECKEIVDRKQKGEFTGELAKVVDEEMIHEVKQEARELRELAQQLEDIKLAYMEK